MSTVFRKRLDRIAYIHAKDTGHVYPKIKQDVGSMTVMEVFTELGKGKVPFKELFDILWELKYSGWVTVELDKTGGTPEGSAGISRDYLRGSIGGLPRLSSGRVRRRKPGGFCRGDCLPFLFLFGIQKIPYIRKFLDPVYTRQGIIKKPEPDYCRS